MNVATDTRKELYTDVVQLERPPEIWTPDGVYKGPTIIDRRKMPVSQTLFQTTREAASRYPAMAPLTSGEWFQTLLALERLAEELENEEETQAEAAAYRATVEDMKTGFYERTSTLLHYPETGLSVEWHNGFFIELPEFDEGTGELIPDEKGVPKGRRIREMALPIQSGYVKGMPAELMPFANAIYGMNEASKQLPVYSFFNSLGKPKGTVNLLRGLWRWRRRENRRVYVNGHWRPSRSNGDVASRVGGYGKIIQQYIPPEEEK